MRSLCNKINLKLKFCTENRIKNSPVVLSNDPEVLKKTSRSFWKSFPSAVFYPVFIWKGLKSQLDLSA